MEFLTPFLTPIEQKQIFDLSFIYKTSEYDDLGEYLKKAKAFKKLAELSDQAHKMAIKSAVAEILILIRMIKEFPEESKKHLSGVDKCAAKYFAGNTPSEIEALINEYGLLTPKGLMNSIEGIKERQQREIRYQGFKKEAYAEDEEFLNRIKAEVSEDIYDEVREEKLQEIVNDDKKTLTEILESSNEELIEKLREEVKLEMKCEIRGKFEDNIALEVARKSASTLVATDALMKAVRIEAERELNECGKVGILNLVYARTRSSNQEVPSSVIHMITDSIANYLRRKYDLVLSVASGNKGQAVYVMASYATHAQIKYDLSNKAMGIKSDLLKFNRYYRTYTAIHDKSIHNLNATIERIAQQSWWNEIVDISETKYLEEEI